MRSRDCAVFDHLYFGARESRLRFLHPSRFLRTNLVLAGHARGGTLLERMLGL